MGPAPREVRAAGITAPVELGQLPEGWMLMEIRLEPDDLRPDCSRLQLAYGDIEPPAGTPDWLSLDVLPPSCAPPPGSDVTLRVGAFTGTDRLFPEGAGGVLSDGRTVIEYASSLPTPDALHLLQTLEPYDPTTRPTPLTP